MEKVIYEFTIKVYEPANMYEIPIRFPGKLIDEHGNLKTGYHAMKVEITDTVFEEFMEWARTHGSILKVIGTQKL